MIAVIDYGIGNLGSVMKAFRAVGAEAVLTGNAQLLREADAIVLPGDGAFGAAMRELRERRLVAVLKEAVASGKPLLGICIGMQLLFEVGEEHGFHSGLAILRGRVRRLTVPYPVPHMGWNRLTQLRSHFLLDGVAGFDHVYFVHSYYCDAEPGVVIASTDYGVEIPAIVGHDNVLGVQFHPEKSQKVGLRIIANFVASCQRGRDRTVATRPPLRRES